MSTAAIGLLALAHSFDFFTFLGMISRRGMAAELNPVVIFIAHDFGLPGLTLAKIGSVAFLGLMILILFRLRRTKTASALVAIGVVAGIIGGISNIASM